MPSKPTTNLVKNTNVNIDKYNNGHGKYFANQVGKKTALYRQELVWVKKNAQ